MLYLDIKMRSKYCKIVKFAENIINFGGKYIFYWKATVFKMPIMLYPDSPDGGTPWYTNIFVEIWNQKWFSHRCGDASDFSHKFFNSTPGIYTCFFQIKCNDGEQYYFSNKLLNVSERCFKFHLNPFSPHTLTQSARA